MLNASPTGPGTAAGAPSSPGKSATEGGHQEVKNKKKFHNGWTPEIERLMAEWADKAICYRWMHERTERIFHRKDLSLMFPIIILSTITGAANFALDSVISDENNKKYVQIGLGGLSIATGILSTVANRLGYSSGSQAHKTAALLWGKFQRLIAIELSLHPDERTDCMHFLKTCRTELDRLIEHSPTIPDDTIQACKEEFKSYPKVRKPEIVGDIDTTYIFEDKSARIKEAARDAALMLANRKGVLKQIVLEDLEPRISRVLEVSTLPAIKEELKAEIAAQTVAAAKLVKKAEIESIKKEGGGGGGGGGDIAKQREERQAEVNQIAMKGVVSAIRKRLVEASGKYGGIGDNDIPSIEITELGGEIGATAPVEKDAGVALEQAVVVDKV